MDKITFCIPSKSNLRYLKTCIPSIRNNAYRNDHEIIIFVDSDEDGTVEWLEENAELYGVKYYINPDLGNSLYGIGRAYDYCIDIAETDIVMVFHADMILGKHADKKAYDLLETKTAVCSTRVEPPLHPNNGEKIIREYGMWPEEFQSDAFDRFVETQLKETKWSEGIFAPWMVYKDEFLSLGGHDPILKSCREDSDVFNRMMLAGFTFKQPWNSLVYHFTGRGAGSFSGDKERHESWQQEMTNSTREFIRKWGHMVKHDEYMKPIIPPKYDITIYAYNCTDTLLKELEPWCSSIYSDADYHSYIEEEQPNTDYDLSARCFDIMEGDEPSGIHIAFDANMINFTDLSYIHEMSSIIEMQEEVGPGTFKLGNLKITIHDLARYEMDLIHI